MKRKCEGRQTFIRAVRVPCPKFGHPSPSSEFYNYALNTEFV